MILNKTTADAAVKGYNTVFNKAFGAVKAKWPMIAMEMPSTKGVEVYVWLGQLPSLREWLGERQVQNLQVASQEVKNKKFESTVGIPEDAFEDDSLGLYAPVFQNMGGKAARLPDKLIFAMMVLGFTKPGYDGVPFFSNSHPRKKGGNWSNLGNKVLSLANFLEAVTLMESLTDEQGEPLGLEASPETCNLVVGPGLQETARQILMAEEISGTTNTARNRVGLVVSPYLAAHSTKWFLCFNYDGLAPFIYQLRRKARMVAKNQVNDDNVFFDGQLLMGVDMRCAAAFGLPQLAFGSTGTV